MRRVAYILSLIFIFVVPWEDMIAASSSGSVARVIGLLLAPLWLMTVLIEGRFRRFHLFHLLLLLFLFWNSLTLYWSLDPAATIERITTYSQIFLIMVVLWEIYQKPGQVQAALQAIVLGGYVLIASTLYNYSKGIVAVAYQGRYSATGVNAVDMALILTIALPIAMHLALSGGSGRLERARKYVNLAFIPAAVYAVLLTGSRTSLLAAIPFVVYLAALPQINPERRLLMFGGAIGLLLLILPFIPDILISRLSTLGASISGQDLGGRVGLWRQSIEMLSKHPLFGIGSGALLPIIGSLAHNTFISVAAETGFIGFVLFVSIVGIAIFQTGRAPGKSAAMWMAVIMTWAIGVQSLSWEFRKLTWLVLGLAVIAGSVVTESERSAPVIPSLVEARQSPDLPGVEKGPEAA